MKERPILFSGAMVRAILEGRKSMTRRAVKPQPYLLYRPETYVVKTDKWGQVAWIDEEGHCEHVRGHDNPAYVTCPYGMPGDRLWVREGWGKDGALNESVVYRADGENQTVLRWRPSIFMPRWASRITLEVTGVRVERLQKITEADALLEGVDFEPRCDAWNDYMDAENVLPSAVQSFASLWSKINSRESWDVNPWVWVVEFSRVDKHSAL